MSVSHQGGCRCGKIRFEAVSDPVFTSYCHCDDCRRATGAPVAAYVGFDKQSVQWTGRPSTYGSPPVERLFCSACGAPLGYRDARIADRIYFLTGAMDDPEAYPPAKHGYAGKQLPWLKLDDDLPRFAATTEPRPEAEACG